MTDTEMSQEWKDDCMKYYGKVLTGKYSHWCYDWDDLPIDETCKEFECCNCYPDHESTLIPIDFVLPSL